jgi:hypothetical protein
MLDPAADPARKIWINCALCQESPGWVYMLGHDGRLIWCQCPQPRCHYRWWHDTGFGRGGAPMGLKDLQWPDQAA